MRTLKLMAVCGLATLGGLALVSSAVAKGESKSDAEFKKMDRNHDGKISPEEHAVGAKWMFDTMDADKDGKVTAAEMDAAQQKVTGQKAKPSDMPAAAKIRVIDKDADGVLSAEEHAAGSRSMFQAMDTNRDDFVTRGELAAGHARMMPKAPR